VYNYYTPYFLFQIEAHAVRHNKTPDISSDINTQAKEVGIFVPTSFYMSILCICKVIFVL
jgi:hypothetical protein